MNNLVKLPSQSSRILKETVKKSAREVSDIVYICRCDMLHFSICKQINALYESHAYLASTRITGQQN